jgi:hypothetical protein
MERKSLIGEPIIALYAEGVSSNRAAENSPKGQKKHIRRMSLTLELLK